MKLFEEAGIIVKHDFKAGKARYEQLSESHHDHLIDIKTGEIIEFVDEEIEKLQEKVAEKYGYELVDLKLELYGVKKNPNNGKKIFIKTFGCQMNTRYDSNRIYDAVKTIGYKKKTKNQNDADCYILNTCHIRDKAKEKVCDEIGRGKKIYKDKKKPIMVVGVCSSSRKHRNAQKRKYIDLVIGPQSYQKINNLLQNFEAKKKIEETDF